MTTCGSKPGCMFSDMLGDPDPDVLGSVNAEPGVIEIDVALMTGAEAIGHTPSSSKIDISIAWANCCIDEG